MSTGASNVDAQPPAGVNTSPTIQRPFGFTVRTATRKVAAGANPLAANGSTKAQPPPCPDAHSTGARGSMSISTCCMPLVAVAVAVGVAERGTVGVREGVGVVAALDSGLAVAVGTPPGVKALFGVAVDPGLGVGVLAAAGGEVGEGIAPVSAAGQMVSDSCCTQRCSVSAA